MDPVLPHRQRHEESSHSDKKEIARDLLRRREGAIADGVPVTAKIYRFHFEEAARDLITEYKVKRRSLDELERRIEKHLTGWSADAFGNPNNHSLVTRVGFNGASLLFMGDLEEDGSRRLLTFYDGPAAKILDADVLQVGHYGSNNATTRELLDAITPNVAVINVGRWSWGQTE